MVDHVTSMGGVRMDPSDIELLSLGVILPSLGTRSLREWTRALGAGTPPPPPTIIHQHHGAAHNHIDRGYITKAPEGGGMASGLGC